MGVQVKIKHIIWTYCILRTFFIMQKIDTGSAYVLDIIDLICMPKFAVVINNLFGD